MQWIVLQTVTLSYSYNQAIKGTFPEVITARYLQLWPHNGVHKVGGQVEILGKAVG